jgi:hypothetical protein
MPPKFHISQRIGRKDRCVLMYRINPDHKSSGMAENWRLRADSNR